MLFEKILAALKTKYSNLGLSNDAIEGLARQLAGFVKEESEIDAAVAGAEATLKAIQSFGDKRATAEAERVKKEFEGKTPPTPGTPPPGDDVPAWAKAIIESNKTLEAKLEGFNAERQSQTLSHKINSILSEKKVPAEFSSAALVGRQFKDETEVQTLADAIVNQYETFKQKSSDLGFSYTEPPEQGKAPKGDSSEIAQMIETGTKEIVEQSKK